MPVSKLHQDLIAYACRTEGWSTARGWREAFIKRAKANPEWRWEIEPHAPLSPEELEECDLDSSDNEEIENECAAAIRGCHVNPDAWRIKAEGPDTPGGQWLHSVLVLELLEVEVSHGINSGKREEFMQLFWALDTSESFYLRVWHMDRHGITRLYLDETTVYIAMDDKDPLGWTEPTK